MTLLQIYLLRFRFVSSSVTGSEGYKKRGRETQEHSFSKPKGMGMTRTPVTGAVSVYLGCCQCLWCQGSLSWGVFVLEQMLKNAAHSADKSSPHQTKHVC